MSADSVDVRFLAAKGNALFAKRAFAVQLARARAPAPERRR